MDKKNEIIAVSIHIKRDITMAKKLYSTAAKLQARIDTYIQEIEASDKMPTLAGLAYHLGMDRRTLYSYSQQEDYEPAIKKTVNWILAKYEDAVVKAGRGAAGIIFLMKNYGYSDSQTIETHNINVDMTDEDRKKRIDELTKKLGIRAV